MGRRRGLGRAWATRREAQAAAAAARTMARTPEYNIHAHVQGDTGCGTQRTAHRRTVVEQRWNVRRLGVYVLIAVRYFRLFFVICVARARTRAEGEQARHRRTTLWALSRDHTLRGVSRCVALCWTVGVSLCPTTLYCAQDTPHKYKLHDHVFHTYAFIHEPRVVMLLHVSTCAGDKAPP